MASQKGLKQMLQRIQATPSQTLIDRYLALVAELDGDAEKERCTLDLAEALLTQEPREALSLAHMVHKAHRTNLRALDVMIAALMARGRHAKAEVLRLERTKIAKGEAPAGPPRMRPSRAPTLRLDDAPPPVGMASGGPAAYPPASSASLPRTGKIVAQDGKKASGQGSQKSHEMLRATPPLASTSAHDEMFRQPADSGAALAGVLDEAIASELSLLFAVRGEDDEVASEPEAGQRERGVHVPPIDLPAQVPALTEAKSMASPWIAKYAPPGTEFGGVELDLNSAAQGQPEQIAAMPKPMRAAHPVIVKIPSSPAARVLPESQEVEQIPANLPKVDAFSACVHDETRVSVAPLGRGEDSRNDMAELFDHYWRQGFVAEASDLLEQTLALFSHQTWWRARRALVDTTRKANLATEAGEPAVVQRGEAIGSGVVPGSEPLAAKEVESDSVQSKGPWQDRAVPSIGGEPQAESQSPPMPSEFWLPLYAELRRLAAQADPELAVHVDQRASVLRDILAKHPKVQELGEGFIQLLAGVDSAVDGVEGRRCRQLLWDVVVGLWGFAPDGNCAAALEALKLTRADFGFWGLYLDALLNEGRARKALVEIIQALDQHPQLGWAKTAYRRLPRLWSLLRVSGFSWSEDLGVQALRECLAVRPEPKLVSLVAANMNAA